MGKSKFTPAVMLSEMRRRYANTAIISPANAIVKFEFTLNRNTRGEKIAELKLEHERKLKLDKFNESYALSMLFRIA